VLKQRILRYSLGLALTFLLLAHASGHFPINFITTLENLSYDFRLSLSLPEKVDKKVVIIDIDEKSLSEIGQWPWQRNIMASIVDKLFEDYQVKVLGFDIVFAEKDEAPSDNYIIEMARTPLAENLCAGQTGIVSRQNFRSGAGQSQDHHGYGIRSPRPVTQKGQPAPANSQYPRGADRQFIVPGGRGCHREYRHTAEKCPGRRLF